ncbi:MAG TPA: hypothetical protein VHN80_28140 [Kineosporiaceae bacterium]|nr:hypothetical protein [Kineosporiaceae bacterium]
MGHSEVTRALLLSNGDIELTVALPNSVAGDQVLISSTVTQHDPAAPGSVTAVADVFTVFTQLVDGRDAVVVATPRGGATFTDATGLVTFTQVIYGWTSILKSAQPSGMPSPDGPTWVLDSGTGWNS